MKSTKKSLIMSTISLVLCFAMLLGSTYAWFTDEVTSGVNQIKAGNLDVELYHSTTATVSDDAANKVTSTTQLFNIEHWEPGMVAYENFMVKNVGNLALKYQLAMTVGDFNTVDGHSLKEVLKVAVVPGGFTGTTRAAAEALTGYTTLENFSTSSNGALLPATAGDTFGVVIYWQPGNNDNLYNLNNGKTATTTEKFTDSKVLGIELGVKLFATQLEHESDSFGNDYDGTAPMKDTYAAATQTVKETVKENEDTVFTSFVTPSNEDGNQTKVTVPKEVAEFVAATEGSTSTMTVEATPTLAANHTFTVSSDGAVGAIDLEVKVNDTVVSEFKNSEGTPISVTVETYVAKNMTNVTLAYNGTGDQPTLVSYEKETGKLVFTTTHFSTFLLGADEVAYLERTNTAYKEFDQAMSNCQNNDTIYMLKNYKYATSPSYVYNSKAKYTIDLNGYTLDFNDSGYGLYVLKGQTVTINDSVGTGKLLNKQCLIYELDGGSIIVNGGHLGGVDKDQATIYGYGNVTVNGGVVDTAKSGDYDYYAVMIGNYTNNNTPAKFIMTAGEVNGSLYINGQDTDANIINISGGAINGSSYIAGQNTTTITGGKFTGTTCFYFKAGTINISGGTFTAIRGDGDWQHKDSSACNTGDAVIIEGCAYPNGSPNANITGGTFKGYKEEGGTESTSGNIFFKNYGILVINYGGNTANMSGTTVPYRNAVVASNTAEDFVTSNGYIHFTDENTTPVTPNAQ